MTVGLVLVSHSSSLATGVAELAGQMAQGKVPIAAAGGAVDDNLGTSADKILEAIQSVDNPDGVLVLLDLGSAILSTEMALEMLDGEQQQRIMLSFAPLVEGAVAAAVEAALGRTLSEVKRAAERTATREQLQLLKPFSSAEVSQEETQPLAPSPATEPASPPDVLEAQLTLTNPTGLHARPASLFVQTAAGFDAKVEAGGHGRRVDAASMFGVLSLNLRQGDTLIIRANGVEARQAVEALSELVRANFYETGDEQKPEGGRPQGPLPSPTTSPAPTDTRGSWQGISTSAGVAVGPALLYTSGNLTLRTVERRAIPAEQVASEQERLRQALTATAQELRTLTTSLQERISAAEAAIFDAQALMLQDDTLVEAALDMIAEQHIDAASALATAGEQQAAMLEALDNSLLAARAVDVRDAISRTLRRLSDQVAPKQDLSRLSTPVVLLAQDLTPSDTASLRSETVLGICTTQGGPTAHAAILARALGIPAMAGLNEAALISIHNGDEVGLDADNGLLYHRPSSEVRTQLMQRLAEQQQQRTARKVAAQQAQAPVYIDGRRVLLLANVGSEAEAEAARQWGAEGIGLLRTEFLFANTPTLPGEDEQCRRYVQVFQAFSGGSSSDASQHSGPIVVRTLDAGADKPMPALNSVLGTSVEANPALGLRGIRISLACQTLLEQQLTALLLATVETGIQLHIMFPMITTVEELSSARAIFDGVCEKLKQRHIVLPDRIPVGIMVEVPAAAMMAAELAELADFFSIGANDLLQYTLACDRTNANVSHLYHPMQPAVLRLIAQIAAAGRRAGKPVAVCGEIASDVRLAPVLVGLGVDELSMTPTALPAVRAALLQYSAQELVDLAQKVLQMRTVAEVERVV